MMENSLSFYDDETKVLNLNRIKSEAYISEIDILVFCGKK